MPKQFFSEIFSEIGENLSFSPGKKKLLPNQFLLFFNLVRFVTFQMAKSYECYFRGLTKFPVSRMGRNIDGRRLVTELSAVRRLPSNRKSLLILAILNFFFSNSIDTFPTTGING